MNRGKREQLSRRLRSWAHGYARRGWPVFALAEGTNVPALSTSLGGHGFRDATCDPDLVDQLWSWFPLGNVGIATGEAAGLSVLDVDPRSEGDQTLAALVAERGPLPAGPTVSTPSGGRHHYFRWRPGMSCSVGQLGPGLDVRTDGGYVCAPPSVRPDGRYAWATDPRTPLADWPEWLLPPTRDPALSNVRPLRPGVEVDAGRALNGLARTVAEAPQGTRNGRLFWAACRLAEHAAAGRVPLDVGAAALLAAAAEAGLPAAESDRTVRSALHRGVAS